MCTYTYKCCTIDIQVLGDHDYIIDLYTVGLTFCGYLFWFNQAPNVLVEMYSQFFSRPGLVWPGLVGGSQRNNLASCCISGGCNRVITPIKHHLILGCRLFNLGHKVVAPQKAQRTALTSKILSFRLFGFEVWLSSLLPGCTCLRDGYGLALLCCTGHL